jgi:hypothetical protein
MRLELLLLVKVAVLADEVTPLTGHPEFVENGVHRADRLAIGTVNAGHRVDEVLFLIVVAVDAVNRTHLKAGSVLHSDARLSYHKWHNANPIARAVLIYTATWEPPSRCRTELAPFLILPTYFVKG